MARQRRPCGVEGGPSAIGVRVRVRVRVSISGWKPGLMISMVSVSVVLQPGTKCSRPPAIGTGVRARIKLGLGLGLGTGAHCEEEGHDEEGHKDADFGDDKPLADVVDRSG